MATINMVVGEPCSEQITGHSIKITGIVKTPDVATIRIKSLENIVERGQVWDRMAKKYRFTDQVPS